MSTIYLFEAYNEALKYFLIPSLDLPIYGNSFIDPNAEVFEKTIAESKQN